MNATNRCSPDARSEACPNATAKVSVATNPICPIASPNVLIIPPAKATTNNVIIESHRSLPIMVPENIAAALITRTAERLMIVAPCLSDTEKIQPAMPTNKPNEAYPKTPGRG